MKKKGLSVGGNCTKSKDQKFQKMHEFDADAKIQGHVYRTYQKLDFDISVIINLAKTHAYLCVINPHQSSHKPRKS